LNKGDGGFIDVTESARVGGGFHLTLGASFADYDNDGDLDLFVTNWLDENNVLYCNQLLSSNRVVDQEAIEPYAVPASHPAAEPA